METTQPTPTTDFALLEGHKENISLSKSGRSAKQLAATLDSNLNAHQEQLAALEDDVRRCADADDPLEPHVRLIRFLKDKPGERKKERRAIENATRAFRKDPRYANDLRFLNLWFLVAKAAPEPEDVFKYLSSNGIGKVCASFYEEYASLLELRKKFKEADEVYLNGIRNAAAPLDRLKRKHEAFQLRMMVPQKQSQHDDDEDEEQEEELIQRPILGSSASIPQRRVVPPPPPSAAPMPPPAQSSYSSSRSKSSTNTNSGKLAIFKDEAPPTTIPLPSSTHHNPYSDYGTRDSQIKENTKQPEPWNKVRIPQHSSGNSKSSGIQVFVDEQIPVSTSESIRKDALSKGILTTSRNPDPSESIKNILNDDIPYNPIVSMKRSSTPPIPAPTTEPNLVFKFRLDEVYHDNHEYSFEEMRARKQMPSIVTNEPKSTPVNPITLTQQLIPPVHDKSDSNPFSSSASSSSPQAFDSSDEDEDAEADRELERLTKLNTMGNKALTPSSEPVSTGVSAFVSKAKAVASPTINTKAALADVYEMFNAKLPAEEYMATAATHIQKHSKVQDDEEFVGDKVVAVKTGLDNKPEWYEIESDETISRRVIQPQASGLKSLGIFVDDENAPQQSASAAAPTAKFSIFQDENSSAEPVKKVRKPLGAKEIPAPKPSTPVVDVQSPFFHDATAPSHPKPLQSSPSIPSATRAAAVAAATSTHNPTKSKPISHSTPYHDNSLSEEDSLLIHPQQLQEKIKTHTLFQPPYQPPRHHNPSHTAMTPITETSFEYTAMSTIASVRYDDDFTGIGRASGVLRESIVRTVLPKRGTREMQIARDDEEEDGDGEVLSSISLASTRGVLSSVEMTNSCVKEVEESVLCENQADENEDIEITNPCNPHSEKLRQHFMTTSDMPVEKIKGYLNLNKMANGPKIGTLLDDALERVPGGGIFEIQFNPQMYVRFRVCKKLVGSTPTNATYIARQLKTGMFAKRPTEDEEQELEDDDEENDEEDEDEGQSSVKRQFLLQVSNPPSSWSFYVLETLRFRLPERTLLSIPTPTSCHLFRDVSCLRTEYSTEMTLFDAISLSAKHSYGLGAASSQKEGGIEELLTCFWAIELLRSVESIHMSGFLHGSISPLSILIRLGRVKTMTGADGFWDPQYDPAGCGGWNAQGVMVGGFSEGVDLFAFPEDQRFLFEKTGARGCWEVMNGVACKYEVDWFGVAEVVHWMLFGKELAVIYEENGDGGRPIGRVGSQWKRYWQVEMWERLFDVLLNLEKASFSVPSNIGGKDEEFADFAREFPPALLIRGVRIEMEKWLVGSCSKAGKSLKSLLQRVEMASLSMM